ncbi:MAG: hypothetical protein R2795_03670 [Saprospiraceae bacterium]
MERTISINAPQAVVFDAVNELKNWESWSPWQEQDPSTKTVYSETSAGAGAYYLMDKR